MNEINEAFDAMFKELQKAGDTYDYPNAARSVIEECRKVVQSRIDGLEKENASLKQDAARYRWLRDQEGLRLESDSMVWTRLDGSKYTSTHFLAANGTCHASLESLDLTVDTAMQYNKETNA